MVQVDQLDADGGVLPLGARWDDNPEEAVCGTVEAYLLVIGIDVVASVRPELARFAAVIPTIAEPYTLGRRKSLGESCAGEGENAEQRADWLNVKLVHG
jgi:hypothetical protein